MTLGGSRPSCSLAQIVAEDTVLRAARNGCREARASLYALVAGPMYGLLRRLVGAQAAEDLFQDTMLLVYERLDEFRGEAPFGAWVRTIAVRRCLMYWRSPWQRARVLLGSAVATDRKTEGSFENLAGDLEPLRERLSTDPRAWVDAALDVGRLLAALPAPTRAVLWLQVGEGCSHEEIAAIFGRSEGWSKSQLSRALARLRAEHAAAAGRGVSRRALPGVL